MDTMTTILDAVVLSISSSTAGRGEAIYRSFSFHGINIWNLLKMHVPTDVPYLKKKITLSYLIANDIVYRIKS